ncbi:MAG: hypothetical protein FWH17_06740 [Oscillospiraceae bacterium]|nr:hypothetical protein [Oscillospiraceae bacterium]
MSFFKKALYKNLKVWYLEINPMKLGGGVLALGTAREASRFTLEKTLYRVPQ